MRQFLSLSATVYNEAESRNYWRKMVFIVRTLIHQEQMRKLIIFFESNHLRRDIAIAQPCIFEQATRQWFYYQSNFLERAAIIKEHYLFINDCFTEEALKQIYIGDGIILWDQEYQNENLSLSLQFNRGSHEKEGLIALLLKVGGKTVYQMIFWLAPNKKNEMALWIGALQGARGGLKVFHGLTKFFYGYRTKNFIFHALCTVASQLVRGKIYAVSNCGFYANNHIRLDRKLKTSLDDFWQEICGKVCTDTRFFELPAFELRKDLAKVESHKRNQYRNRFAMLDTIDSTIINSLEKCLLKKESIQNQLQSQ